MEREVRVVTKVSREIYDWSLQSRPEGNIVQKSKAGCEKGI